MTATEGITQVSALATHTALSVWTIANALLVLLVLGVLLFLFAWYVGRGPFTALLLALYAAYAPFDVFPFSSILPSATPLIALLSHIGLYIAFVLVFYLILRRVIVSDFLYIGIFGLIILSLLGAAFLIAIGAHMFSITSVYQFTPIVQSLFAADQYFFWWFIAPMVGLFIFAR